MTGMIEWVQKSKPKNIRRASNPPPPTPPQKKVLGPKIYPLTLFAELRSRDTSELQCTKNLQIVLNTPKNPYLNQATKNDIYKIFLAKKIPESKISNPNKILRSFPPLEIWSIPLDIRTDIKFRILHPGFLT